MSLGNNRVDERPMDGSCGSEGGIGIDGPGCFGDIDFESVMAEDMKKFHFADLNAAYDFYNEYGRIKGFSIRRSKLGMIKMGLLLKLIIIYVC